MVSFNATYKSSGSFVTGQLGMYMPHDEQAVFTNQEKISTDLHETEGKKTLLKFHNPSHQAGGQELFSGS